MKKGSALSVAAILATLVLLSGCYTTMGAAKGTVYTTGATAVGAGKDAATTYGAILALDKWLEKTFW
jgi:ABC-type uncharacterized transport system auxiliary subunit